MRINLNEKLKELSIENMIWIIYIFISIFAIISNYFEQKYYNFHIFSDRKKQRYINLAIFTVAIIIYLYFLYNNIKHIKDNNYSFLSIFASTLFLIGGIIILYVEYISTKNENIAIL